MVAGKQHGFFETSHKLLEKEMHAKQAQVTGHQRIGHIEHINQIPGSIGM